VAVVERMKEIEEKERKEIEMSTLSNDGKLVLMIDINCM
jgi:hypothetical protein